MINREFIEKIEDMTGPKVIETNAGYFFGQATYTELKTRLIDTTKSVQA